MGKGKGGGGRKKNNGAAKESTKQRGKADKAADSGSSKTSCKHRSTAQAGFVERALSEHKSEWKCKEEDCFETEAEALRVCLGCGIVSCVSHAKKHWSKAKTDRHSLTAVLAPPHSVYCYNCDVEFDENKLTGDVSKCVEAIHAAFSGVDGEEETEDDDDDGRGKKKKKKKKGNQQQQKEKAATSSSESKSSSSSGASGSVSYQHQSKVVRGLKNLGNTCYFNSCLQSLAHLDELRRASVDDGAGPIGRTLISTVLSMWNGGQSLSPQDLLKQLRVVAPQFRGGAQQDAHEALRCLVDAVDTECVKKRSPKNLMRQLFLGETTSFITCHTCKKSSQRREEMFDVCVEMVQPEQIKQMKKAQEQSVAVAGIVTEEPSLEETLGRGMPIFHDAEMSPFKGKVWGRFIANEWPSVRVRNLLDEDGDSNSNDAALSGSSNNRTEQLLPQPEFRSANGMLDCRAASPTLHKFPFLNHFTSPELLAGSDAYKCSHCNAPREASKQLLLGPRLPNVACVAFKRFKQDRRGHFAKINSREPVFAELDLRDYCVPSIAESDESTFYELVSVIEHIGTSLHSGHYVAYCKEEKGWVYISDTSVRLSSVKEAVQSIAVVCMYKRRKEGGEQEE